MTSLLVTGGAGFIGRTFLRVADRLLGKTFKEIRVLDKLTYASDYKKIEDLVDSARINFSRVDISKISELELVFGNPDMVVNFAAESHVDNSISAPGLFALSNYVGTSNLLELSVSRNVRRFMQISTDEVYGSVLEGEASEDWLIRPSSPYSASKAAADGLALAFATTFGLDVVITRTCNNYGPGQHSEKLIPKAVASIKKGEPVAIYGSGEQIREWIDVRDNAEALLEVLLKPDFTGVVNIGSGQRESNLALVKQLLDAAGYGAVVHVEDRLGHDMRYALSSARFETNFAFRPKRTLANYIEELQLSALSSKP